MTSDSVFLGGEKRSPTAIGSALAVLRCFSADRATLGVTEIAASVGLHKSSVSRLLTTLELEDLVEQDPTTKRYRLGMGVVSLAAPVLADLDARRACLPALQALTARLDETSALVVWNGAEAVVVEQVPAARPIKHTSPLGTAYGTIESSSARVFLAAMPADRRPSLPGAGGARIDLDAEARAQVSINDGLSAPDEVGVAAPVRDHRGEVVAAVLVSAPRFRVDSARLEVLATECRRAAHDISARLGHVAAPHDGA